MLKQSPDGLVTSPAVLLTARRGVELPAVIEDRGRTWSWTDLADYADAVAADLERLGDVRGSRVTLTTENTGHFVGALFGIWLAGAVPVPLSYRLPAAERERVLQAVDAAAHVVWAGLGLDGEIQLDDDVDADRAVSGARSAPRVALDAPGIVLCTSGTTGRPKAVVHPMRGVWGMIDGISRHVVDPDDLPAPKNVPPRRVESKPIAHIGALFGIVFDTYKGRSSVLMPRFDAHRYAELIRRYEIPLLSLVPSMIRMLLDSDVGQLSPPARLATTGTAPLPPAWRTEFEQRFGVPVQITYGQTETCGAVAYEPLEDVLGGTRRPGTAGRVVPQVEVQIRDDAGQVLPPGEIGQIWVHGETLRPTVLGDSDSRTADGWLNTGDVGRLDEDNYIYLTGRNRELIIRGGLKIVPAEVENALLEHPAIVEVAVDGRPDDRLGEVPVAWVRTHAVAVTQADVLDFLRERLAGYKLPVAVYQVSEFPRTDTGKIRKHELGIPAGSAIADDSEVA